MEQYQITSGQYHILLLFAELPLLAIWFAAFYGYRRLHQYAEALDGAPEAKAIKRLAYGCTWLAWSLPIPTLISLICNGIANAHPGFHSASIIIANYINVVFALIALTIISSASRSLLNQSKAVIGTRNTQLLLILFVLIGVTYCYFTFGHLDLKHAGDTNNPYFMPSWLITFTVIAPSLYTWFVGLVAAFDISSVARKSSGLLYRRSLQLLASGLTLVIASLVAVQYVHSVVPRVGHLSINGTFLTINIFYLVAISGFALMSYGANRLKKIEEV
jgi:hypothetical protein